MSHKGVLNEAFQNDADLDGSHKNISLTQIKYKNEDLNGPYPLPTLASPSSDTKPEVKNVEEVDEEERGQWDNQCEFILSTVGYAVGLGNVWRFPYLAYTNGGGSFLIPYVIMLFFAGLPLFFMELALGQYSRQGPTKVFGRIAPVFQGLGLAMLGATFFVGIYYNMIIGWTLFYMFSGFTSELPWEGCTPNVSSHHCIEANRTIETNVSNLTIIDAFRLEDPINGTEYIEDNFSNVTLSKMKDPYAVAPPEDYFLHQMLGLDKEIHDWDNVGGLRWQMVVCLFGGWVIVCLSLINGVQSSGKVNIFILLESSVEHRNIDHELSSLIVHLFF